MTPSITVLKGWSLLPSSEPVAPASTYRAFGMPGQPGVCEVTSRGWGGVGVAGGTFSRSRWTPPSAALPLEIAAEERRLIRVDTAATTSKTRSVRCKHTRRIEGKDFISTLLFYDYFSSRRRARLG